MHELLSVRAAELSRLASTVRGNHDQAEALIPVVNRRLAELAAMGVEDLQVEGPAIDSRPQGLSIGKTNDHSIYQAVVVMPGGVGTVLWNSTEVDESMNRPYGEPFRPGSSNRRVRPVPLLSSRRSSSRTPRTWSRP